MSDAAPASPKWGSVEMLPLPARFNAAVRARTAARRAEIDAPWQDVVFARQFELFTTADAEAIEREALDEGVRFDFSATVSLESEPEKYRRPERADAGFGDAAETDGRRQVGAGDNVIRRGGNVRGSVALISTTEHVMTYLSEGVPEGTIAVIDDSGGTLTAPIIEGFAGVICLGGSVRSHLGILAREYGVPTLMNVSIGEVRDGQTVEIEVSADIPAADAYETGNTRGARIWIVSEES